MHICVFEDDRTKQLGPLTLTRPTFDLWCGAGPLLRRQMRAFATAAVGAVVRPELAALCRLCHPEMAVNDLEWLAQEPTVWVNARWLPFLDRPVRLNAPSVGMVEDEVAYVLPPSNACTADVLGTLSSWLDRWRRELPPHEAGGRLLDQPWELIESNAAALEEDHRRWCWKKECQIGGGDTCVLGPRERVVIAPDAELEPWVVLDATVGPILIDRRAVIRAFSRLEGPCYIGPDCRVRAARISGSSLGPDCRVTGEIEASVLQGHVNKQHDGFLGHSYLGEWVNLGAGTQVADLRNDYRTIAVACGDRRRDSRRLKLGAFLGDHTRTGIGTLLNPGTVVGAFARLQACGSSLPGRVPSFGRVREGRLEERTDLRSLFDTARIAMRRRGCEWTADHQEFFFDLYERTVAERHSLCEMGPASLGGYGRLP